MDKREKIDGVDSIYAIKSQRLVPSTLRKTENSGRHFRVRSEKCQRPHYGRSEKRKIDGVTFGNAQKLMSTTFFRLVQLVNQLLCQSNQ